MHICFQALRYAHLCVAFLVSLIRRVLNTKKHIKMDDATDRGSNTVISQRKIWHYTHCLLHPYQYACRQHLFTHEHTDSVKYLYDSETQPRLNSPRWKMNHLLSSRGLIGFWKSAWTNDFFSFTEISGSAKEPKYTVWFSSAEIYS